MGRTTEEERREGKPQKSFCPLSWRVPVHHNFSDDGFSEYATVAVSKQYFRQGN